MRCCWTCFRELRKRKTCFVEVDMSRYEHTFCLWIVAPVATLIHGVSQKNTASRPWRELVWGGGFSVRIAETTKDAQMRVIRWRTEKKGKGCVVAARATRAPVEQVRGGRKGVRPERRREGSLEQESSNAVVDGAKNTFCTTVLLRRVRACQP